MKLIPPGKKSVLILQEHLPEYRVRFFELLRQDLASHGLPLRLLCSPHVRSSLIEGRLDWAVRLDTHRWGPVVWQNVLPFARLASLVIAPQETKYLAVPLLLFLRRWGRWKFAFWGHGKNFQARHPDSLAERWKRFLSVRADWWFAYNDRSAQVVRELGFPSARITSVQNSVDTQALARGRARLTEQELQSLRSRLGFSSENVVVFTGGLYPGKRIPFLLQTCRRVRERIPDLQLIVIGLGPDSPLVERAARTQPWIHYLGPRKDLEKIPPWALAKLVLMPGGVGLVAVDSFALGVPMVTTACPNLHGPEIGYLRDGQNARIVGDWDSVEAYAEAVVFLLQNEAARAALVRGCLESAGHFSLEDMSRRFCGGILRCLQASPSGDQGDAPRA